MHKLDPLMRPGSIAILGASPTEGALGRFTVEQALNSTFGGSIWAINPKYEDVLGIPCYPDLESLPGVPDHLVIAVANSLLEEQIARAIALGVRSATIFASCYLPSDSEDSSLASRIQQMASDAGMLLCGGNCLGFYNLEDGIRSSWFPHPELLKGNIGLIAHSGSVFVTLSGLDKRLRFNYIVSSGQELTVTAADYLDFMLESPTTRVVGIFLEAVRNPENFRAALEKANRRGIPVVALKVGRTARSAELAQSHSGAIAGDDAAYEALFDRYGVARVASMDEFSATLQLMSQPKPIGAGNGIVGLHDSGGQRGMAIDLADDIGVPYAKISPATKEILSNTIDYGLAPENPLDIWGTGRNFEQIFDTCFNALMAEPDTAMGILFSDIGGGGVMDLPWVEATKRVAEKSDKPVLIAQNISRTADPDWLTKITVEGLPVIDGIENALKAARHWMKYRDFLGKSDTPPEAAPEDVVKKWTARLVRGDVLSEAEALSLFGDFGIEVPNHIVIESTEDILNLDLTFPVVLKTAMPDILHKSDVGGVRLGLSSQSELLAAYEELRKRLGPKALVAETVPAGTELAVGLVSDPQFGPLLVLSAGGVLIEVLRDRKVLLPPISEEEATRQIQSLRIFPVLEGVRGKPATNIDALARAVSRFSVLVSELGDNILEMDANPLIAGAEGTYAVDGLVVPKA